MTLPGFLDGCRVRVRGWTGEFVPGQSTGAPCASARAAGGCLEGSSTSPWRGRHRAGEACAKELPALDMGGLQSNEPTGVLATARRTAGRRNDHVATIVVCVSRLRDLVCAPPRRAGGGAGDRDASRPPRRAVHPEGEHSRGGAPAGPCEVRRGRPGPGVAEGPGGVPDARIDSPRRTIRGAAHWCGSRGRPRWSSASWPWVWASTPGCSRSPTACSGGRCRTRTRTGWSRSPGCTRRTVRNRVYGSTGSTSGTAVSGRSGWPVTTRVNAWCAAWVRPA